MAISPTAPRFRRLLLNAIIVPMVLMIAIAGVLVWQIERLLATSAAADHSDEVISAANHLQKLTVDLETGVRGFLITGEDDFLEPYNHAMTLINGDQGAAAQLAALVDDNPPQQRLLREITDARQKWLKYVNEMLQLRRQGRDYVTVIRERNGKALMDEMRYDFQAFISHAEQTRKVRNQRVQTASRVTLGLTAVVAILAGAFLAGLSRSQFRALSSTYEQALRTANDLNTTLEARVEQRTRELHQRSEQLADANKELEAFAYSVSHDLRAPMRHITGFVDLLRKSLGERLGAGEQRYLDTIYDSAKLAGQMVDDLLAFSRVGRAELKYTTVDMNAIVSESRHELQPDTDNRHIDWKVADLPAARGDAALIKLAFRNLISNAIKYTGKQEDARIEIGVMFGQPGADQSDPNHSTPLFFIKDNGVGFDMAYSDKLFGVFQRLHRAEDFEGTGIGLANVRRIIVRHGGKIWAQSEPGHGATFYFTLPSDSTTVNET